MKTTNSHPQPLRWLIGIAGLIILFHLVVILLVSDENLRTTLNDLVAPVENTLMAGVLFATAYFTRPTRPQQAISWHWWAVAFVFYALGDLSWAVFEVFLHEAPFPSIADLFYFSFYIFMWLGLVRYPVSEFAFREQKLVVLDNLIVIIGAGLAFWVLLINPLILVSGEVDFVTILLAVAYPILDLVLFWTLLIFFRNRLEQSIYLPLMLVGSALFSEIVADSFFAYQSVNEAFVSGSVVDLGWIAGSMLFVLASAAQVKSVSAQANHPQGIPEDPRLFNSWPLYLPYLWLAVSYGLLVTNTSLDSHALSVYLVVGLLGALVIFRQVLTLNDNEHLFNQAEAELVERKRAQAALSQLNLDLDARVQQRTQELFAANEQLVQTNLKVEESLREKETLLKEIHHRVKNNLQVIVSLLRMQARSVTDAETVSALHNSQTRVQSISLIHEKLYQSKNLAKIDFGDYLKSLTANLFHLYQTADEKFQVRIQTNEITLELERAVPCGLIMNELITNAMKYAFPDGKKGTIWVELHASPEQKFSLQVADDGIGLPADFDLQSTRSLGLQLVSSLVSQLGGSLEVERSGKTVFRVSFAR
jgi:two-component sensor histidine kinase